MLLQTVLIFDKVFRVMLLKLLPYLKDDVLIVYVNKYLYSPFHILVVAILLTISEIFSIEWPVYYLLLITSFIIPALISEDMTPLVPFGLMFQIGVSAKTAQYEPTIVMGKNIVHFWIIFPIFAIVIVGRLIFDIVTNKDRRHHYPRFLAGFICIAIAYLVGGLGSPYYSFKSAMFGLREFLAMGGVYLYCVYSLDLKKMHKDYFAWMFLIFGLAISAEVIATVSQGVTNAHLFSGWGINNDMAGVMAMTLGGAGYLAVTKRAWCGWLFVLVMAFMLSVIGLTGSRGGFFTALFIILIVSIIIFIKAPLTTTVMTGIITIAFIITFSLLLAYQSEFMHKYFGRILGDGINYSDINSVLSGRWELWKSGLNSWKENVLLGVGWYHNDWHDFIFQARFHNTYIQLLATAGLIGIGAYAFHRIETLIRIFHHPKMEKSFAAICILGLLIASLVDCHFFNIYPGFSYAFLLVFIESRDIKVKEPPKENNLYNTSVIYIYY